MEKLQCEQMNLSGLAEAETVLSGIGCTAAGVRIMREKALFYVLKIPQVESKAANLLKQTFLAKGADAAVSKNAADLSEKYTDILIFATLRQYRQAIPELYQQPWGLKKIAAALELFFAEKQSKEEGFSFIRSECK